MKTKAKKRTRSDMKKGSVIFDSGEFAEVKRRASYF